MMAYRETTANREWDVREILIEEGSAVREGSAVPRREPTPEPEPRRKSREELSRERGARMAIRRNRERSMAMNPRYVAFLAGATAVCFCVCAAFVHLRADNTTRLATITNLQEEVSELQDDNDSMEKQIQTLMSLEEVKEAALALGMTTPSSEQIRYYSVSTRDYMNQLSDVPPQ